MLVAGPIFVKVYLRRSKPLGLIGGVTGRLVLPDRKHRQKAFLPFSAAGRLHAFNRLEGQMQQPALAAIHGRKCVRNSALDDLVRGDLGLKPQFLGAQRLEVCGVKADQVVLALVETQHLRGDGLQRAQQLSIVLGDQRDIGSAEFHVNLAGLKAFGVARAVSGGDAVFEAQSA